MTALSDIIARLEAGEAIDPNEYADLEVAIHNAAFPPEEPATWCGPYMHTGSGSFVRDGRWYPVPKYLQSMDSADRLMPEGWRIYDLHESDDRTQAHCHAERISDRRLVESGLVATKALALCIAALKARLA